MTPSGLTKCGPILSSFMNQFFKDKVERLKENTTLNKPRALFYTRKYVEANPSLYKEDFNFKTTDIDTLRRHISSLSNTSALGIDGIPTAVIKKFARAISPALLHIINLAITTSTYP